MHLQTDSVLDKGGLRGVSAYQSMHSSSSNRKRCMASAVFRRAKTAAILYMNQSGSHFHFKDRAVSASLQDIVVTKARARLAALRRAFNRQIGHLPSGSWSSPE